jgi:hypothetical protein
MVSNAPEPESVTSAIPPVLRWTFPIGFMGIGLVFLLLGGFEIREGLKDARLDSSVRQNP